MHFKDNEIPFKRIAQWPMIQNQFDINSFLFTFNNSLATKIKKLDGHVAQTWTPIEIQFRV